MEENHHIILFSALDWGLGHTTRSIPILTHFNKKGIPLMIAVQTGSASEKILRLHFPGAVFLPLQGYGITYAKKRFFFGFKIFLQIPKILKAIHREHKFVKKIVSTYPIGLIIADNRYGFYHRNIPSVFISHQLRIAAPLSWMETMIQKINYRYIQRFSELWIPDLAGTPNLGGKLSHPDRMPDIAASYIGLLSRLMNTENLQKDSSSAPNEQSTFKYLFLLSGPEPQRSILEKRLLEIIPHIKGKSILVRGLPGGTINDVGGTHVSSLIHNLMNHQEQFQALSYAGPDTLIPLIKSAEFVVSRSGYSTVMDLLLLGKKGIYIPTPGQTEQQYLAKRLMENQWGFSMEQEEKDYLAAFRRAEAFSYKLPKDFSRLTLRLPSVTGFSL